MDFRARHFSTQSLTENVSYSESNSFISSHEISLLSFALKISRKLRKIIIIVVVVISVLRRK